MKSSFAKPPLKVLLLTDCLSGLTAGAEKQIYELAKGLDKEQFYVYIASMDTINRPTCKTLEEVGAYVQVFKVKRIYGWSGLVQGIKFWRFLKEQKINAVITYHFGSDIWGTLISRLAGITHIYSNRRDMGFWRNSAHVLAYRFVNPFVKRIVVVSQSIKDMIIKTEGVNAAYIDVIHNGVDIPVISIDNTTQIKQDLGLGVQDFVIMHVANLKPVKGHEFLLKAMKDIVGQHANAKLILIGKDEMSGELKQLASSLNISSNVLFLGERRDVRKLLTIADLCVLPSLSEGMSNAILEYMSAAKAIVATDVGGNSELVKDTVNGLLVEAKNSDQLSRAILTLIHDGSLRERMGQESRRIAQDQFSLTAMIGKYQSVLLNYRVLHLISSGGFYGAERVIMNLVTAQPSGYSTVGALNNQHNAHLEIIDEAKRLNITTAVFNCSGLIDLKTVSAIRRYIKDNAIDIIHTHNYKADFYGFLVGAPWVVTNHGWIKRGAKLQCYEALDAVLMQFARHVIAVSAKQRQQMISKNIIADKITCIDNGIPVDQFTAIDRLQSRQLFNISPDDTVIVMVGRLSEEKGHHIVCKAMRAVKLVHPQVKCLIVGDGPLKGAIEEMIVQYELTGTVILTGIRQDMPQVYAASDILVNASFTEGLPMTILEAMASKVAVIATNVGAVGDIVIHQESGILLKPGDDQTLSAALNELIDDKAKRQRFTQRAYDLIETRYSASAMAKSYDAIYRKVV